jgi:hypothetical protein
VGLCTRERVGVNGGARGRAEATRAVPGSTLPRAGAAHRGRDRRALGAEGLHVRGLGSRAAGGRDRTQGGRRQGRGRRGGKQGRAAPPWGRGAGACGAAPPWEKEQGREGPRRRGEGAGAGPRRRGGREQGRAAPPKPKAAAPGPQGVTREGCRGRARRGEEGEGEENRGEESSPRGSNFGDHHLQDLGHHRRERDGRERGRLLRGRNQMSQTDLGEGRAWGGQGRAGRTGSGWAALGHTADRNPRHARPLNGIQSQTKIRNGTRRTRDIRQRNALRHDATPMTLRFCLYMTRTPVTILV